MGQLLNNPILHRSKLNPGPDECRGKSADSSYRS